MSKKIIIFGGLVVIMAIGIFFRVWQIDKIPPGIYPDEAMNGVNALETRDTNQWQVYYPDNNGREGLMILLLAIAYKFLPATAWSLRLISIIVGSLTVLGLYFLAKELFKSKSYSPNRWFSPGQCLALTSAFLLAVSFWHVNFSRIAFRAIFVPFLTVWCFYFLWRYFRHGQIISLIVSGIFFSLGFYTYIAFRMAPLLILIAWLPYLWRWYKDKKQNKLPTTPLKTWHIVIYVLVIIAVVSPIAIYFAQHPEQFMGRASDVAAWKTASPVKNTLISFGKTLGMFNIYGDCNWRHNLPCQPQLLWPESIGFLVGLIIVIRNIILGIRQRCQKLKLDMAAGPLDAPTNNQTLWPGWHVSIFILCWLGLMMLPAALTNEGLPHALRAIGTIPPAYLLTALGLVWLYSLTQNKLSKALTNPQTQERISIKNQIKRIKIFLTILFILSLIAIGAYQYQKYFITWAQNPNTAGAFTQKYVQMAEFLNFYSQRQIPEYVIVNEGGVLIKSTPVSAETIKYLTYGKSNPTYLLPEQLDQIKTNQDKKVNALIILMQDNKNLLNQIIAKYPKAITGNVTTFGEFRFISI